MATILNEIGFFQFDNLIRNQIPFALLNLGVDLKGLYKMSHHQGHLEKLSISATAQTALETLKQRHHPQHEAVVVICEVGSDASSVVDQLEQAGYMNVFFVKGGLQALKADAMR